MLWNEPVRNVEDLERDALAVIDKAVAAGGLVCAPLLSGGHDSIVACHLASKHPSFGHVVHHINTGIGARAARLHVEAVCKEFGWRLVVHRSPITYERFVRERGFPGPGRHQWIYNRVKDRCIRVITPKQTPTILITGCRKFESTRRMGHVDPVQVGEVNKEGKVRERKRIWTAPCHDWSEAEQRAYMNAHSLPENPIKRTPLAMSGECFCGAYAIPGERRMIEHYAPDVAEEIDRLTPIARECGTHAEWGTRPPDEPKGIVNASTGPLCNGCDRRLYAAGVNLFSGL